MSNTMFDKNVGAYIRFKRLEKKLTQSKVAQWINVTFQQIQKYEKGNNAISLWKFAELVKRFGDNESIVISNCRDNLYLPDKLIEEGKIQVATVTSKEIADDPTHRLDAKYWIDKKSE